jgi:hypothetical protein
VAPPFDYLAQAIAIVLTLPDPPPPDFERALILLEQVALFNEMAPHALPERARKELQRFISRRLAIAPRLAARLAALR